MEFDLCASLNKDMVRESQNTSSAEWDLATRRLHTKHCLRNGTCEDVSNILEGSRALVSLILRPLCPLLKGLRMRLVFTHIHKRTEFSLDPVGDLREGDCLLPQPWLGHQLQLWSLLKPIPVTNQTDNGVGTST